MEQIFNTSTQIFHEYKVCIKAQIYYVLFQIHHLVVPHVPLYSLPGRIHYNEYYHLLNDIYLLCSIKPLPYKLIHRLSYHFIVYFLNNRHCLLSNRTDIFLLEKQQSSCSLWFNTLIFPFGTNQKCLCLILAINGSIYS